MTGAIMGVEAQQQPAGKEAVVNVEQLNLWCADGMRSVKLADVQRVRFLNPVMDNEVRKALETLTLSHDTQKKAVSLNFVGEGKRNVRVGYVIENPIWKTSYRLVLGKEKEDKPFLQGWAVVENATDEDWKDVRMALVSGRPISFQMDLYTPLYVPRPTVVPELFASLRPVTYNDDLEQVPAPRRRNGLRRFRRPPMARRAPTPAIDLAVAGHGAGASSPMYGNGSLAEEDESWRFGRLDDGDGDQAGRLLPVRHRQGRHPAPPEVGPACPSSTRTWRARAAASTTNAPRPSSRCLGLKFKNTSGLHLMQGPITVFEGSNYAGDARILDVEPNEERLLSYAVDLGTEVNPVPSSDNGRLTLVKVNKGILYIDHEGARDEDVHHRQPQRRRAAGAGRASRPQRLPPHRRHQQARRDRQRRLPL